MKVVKMECKKIEELLSEYIENELSPEVHDDVSRHLEKCLSCQVLKEQMEELMFSFPELEEEVPFFLKNRLYYIPESREEEDVIQMESSRGFLRWMAAVLAGLAFCLGLFYTTNIYPPANRALHTAVAGLESVAVKTEAIYERVKESKMLFFLSPRDKGDNGETAKDAAAENKTDKNPSHVSMENNTRK